MTQRTLQKWHGAGNDFLVDLTAGDASWWTATRVQSACDRRRGVGADGVIIGDLSGDTITMTLFNADGSRAEISGNGIRCLVAAVRRSSGDPRTMRRVETDAGPRDVSIQLTGDEGIGEVAMGTVTVHEPIDGSIGYASCGNPHVVVADQTRWSEREREDLARTFSAQVNGANVEFVTVNSRDAVSMVVYERGVGWTLACGTGSVAVVAILHGLDLVNERVRVANPGGDLEVSLDGDNARLGGPVRFVADLTWFPQ